MIEQSKIENPKSEGSAECAGAGGSADSVKSEGLRLRNEASEEVHRYPVPWG